MAIKNIYITDNDMRRWRELILVARQFRKEEEKYLQQLEGELERGRAVKCQDINRNTITMSSEVHVRELNAKEEIE